MPDELATLESQPGAEASSAATTAASEKMQTGASEESADVPAGTKPPQPPKPPTVDHEGSESDEPTPASPSNKRWYVVKVQSGREESIKEAIERRVKIEGLTEFFGQIIIPVEK